VTWKATGEEAGVAARALRGRPGVEMLAPFGSTVHVSGTDEAALEGAIAPWRGHGGIAWERIEPTLEDVFIHLMAGSRDNFA
jgi:ABC-2 type transport system ATP-binding protein